LLFTNDGVDWLFSNNTRPFIDVWLPHK
jgi:hypothetical protein